MHWHPIADKWQYYVRGTAQVTVFDASPKAVTNNFTPGDVGYVKRNNGHYVKNEGDVSLAFLEIFNSPTDQNVSLSDWLTHDPPALVAAHLIVAPQDVSRFPSGIPNVMPL